MVIWLWIMGLPSLSILLAFLSWGTSEWIYKPWRLILACRQQGIAGFPFIPFMGQLPQISKAMGRLDKESGRNWEALKSAQQCVEKHGKVFYFTTGKTVRICVANVDLVKTILANNADSYAKPSFIHVLDILGDGLFAANGEEWARQRQLLGLSFSSREIKGQVKHITSITHVALEKWFVEMNTNSGELEVYHKLLEITLNVIRRLAFGAEPAMEVKTSLRIAEAFDRYLHNCRELVFGAAAAVPGFRFLPTSTNREISQDRKWLSTVIEELIEARSRAYASSTEERDQRDFLDLLMGAVRGKFSKELSSQQLRDNSFTILLAGHHTTASLLTWAMYMLAVQPLWQERARAEVEEFCGEGEFAWATLSRLKTIAMILQETLRLFPPVPLIGRLCLQDNSVGPYTIPQGVEILIPTAVIHRDKDLWGEDADQFMPMRFANGISKACKHNLGYLPFGYGPRTCVGQTLALAEAKAVLAVILPAFTWRLGPGYRHCPDVSLTLQPKFDIPLVMEKLK